MACSSCRSSSCTGCSSCSSTPYYQQADSCIEDHTQVTCEKQYSFSVCPESSWNVPVCGQTAVLSLPGLDGILVGAYLWNEGYGYFKITSADTVSGTIGITNTCPAGIDYQASPGTQIPECTCFIITTPPIDLGENANQCLTVGFTAPAEGDTIDITLTNTEGLAVGDTIQLGSGFYYVAAIKPNNIISITNTGDGITPGTPVVPYDANGNPLYCISIISTTPCTRDSVEEGAILACSDDDLVAPLDPDTFDGVNTDATSAVVTTVVSPINTGTTAPITLNFTNNSPTRPMTVMVFWSAYYSVVFSGASATTTFLIESSVNGGAYSTFLSGASNYANGDSDYKQLSRVTTHSIAATGTLSLASKATLTGTNFAIGTAFFMEMKAIAISI